MLTHADVRDYVVPRLKREGFTPKPHPGPDTDPILQRLVPGPIVFLMVGGGPGLILESLYDRPFIGTRYIGKQQNFADAEAGALLLDHILCDVENQTDKLGTTRTLYVTRTGGAPRCITQDAGNRFHFVCSYIAQAATGL